MLQYHLVALVCYSKNSWLRHPEKHVEFIILLNPLNESNGNVHFAHTQSSLYDDIALVSHHSLEPCAEGGGQAGQQLHGRLCLGLAVEQ